MLTERDKKLLRAAVAMYDAHQRARAAGKVTMTTTVNGVLTSSEVLKPDAEWAAHNQAGVSLGMDGDE